MLHRIVVCILLLCLVFAGAQAAEVPSPAPLISAGAWNKLLSGAHPRLLGGAPHVQELARTKASNYRDVVKPSAAEFLLAAGIVEAVEGVSPEVRKRWIKEAVETVAKGVSNIHQETWIRLELVAQVYDFFHDDLSTEQRKTCVDWFNAHLETFTTNEGAFHNSTTAKILTYLKIAYATWNENPSAKNFRDHALLKLYEGKVLPVLLEFGQGGGDTESGWYARGKIWHLVQAMELARRMEGYDGFSKAPQFFYQRMAYEMHEAYPGRWTFGAERFPNEGDGSFVYGSHTEYPRQQRTLLAQYFRGSPLARMVENGRRRASNPHVGTADFFWEEPAQIPLPAEQTPLAHLARGTGHLYARSDWSPDATWLRFTCGDFFAPHQHLDVGNFELFRREPLVTESGEYADYGNLHSMNWLMRSIAHNVLLVHQPDEKWPVMRDGGRVPYANDGGQMWKWKWPASDLQEWKKQADSFERGNIVAYQNDSELLYVAGDCSAAYSKSKLEKWIRQIVFLRPHTVVILDRVVSTDPSHQKTWLIHTQNEPTLEKNSFSATNGTGRVVVQTLLPRGAQYEKIQGYLYGGKTFDPPPNWVESNVAPRWRVEVKPATSLKQDVFLHVLFTGDGAVPSAKLEQANPVVLLVGEMRIQFDAEYGGQVRFPSKSTTLSGTVVKGVFE